MTKLNLNEIPTKVKNKEITQKEAIDFISSFIINNYPVFGLHHYDEDFREEIILQIIEKGKNILSNYNPAEGDFFNYIYCYITYTVRTLLRSSAKQKIIESVVFSEQSKHLEEKEYNYNNIDYKSFSSPVIPYAPKKVSPEDLRSAFSNINKDKELLVIAMKSAFYLTDNQIKKVCKYYGLEPTEFYKTIEFYKSSLAMKNKRKEELIKRRNNAYYNHKKYEKQLSLLDKDSSSEEESILKDNLLKKDQKQYNSWKTITSQLQNGILAVRPSNKTIAQVLGICERQVIYYIKRAKKREEKNS